VTGWNNVPTLKTAARALVVEPLDVDERRVQPAAGPRAAGARRSAIAAHGLCARSASIGTIMLFASLPPKKNRQTSAL
jgi:hypothetical protein